MSVPPTVDSPDAAATLGRQLSDFNATTRSRGAAYHRKGQVLDLSRERDHFVVAHVEGSSIYEVEWERTADGWFSSCSCPIGESCKHAYAAALAWLAELSRDTVQSTTTLRASPRETAPHATRSAAPSRRTFRQEWESILADKLGRALTAEEGSFLGKLSNIYHNFRNIGWLSGGEIRQLGFETIESRRPMYEERYQGWWEQFPRDPLELWQYFAHDIESSGLAVPAFMRPITDTAPVRARIQGRQRKEAVKRWKDRFKQLAGLASSAAVAPVGDVTLIQPLELRLCVGPQRWSFEMREQSEAPWKPVPRSFIDRYARNAPAGLAMLDTAPAVYAFLALCQEHNRVHYSIELKPESRSGRELLHRLLAHRLARTLVVDPIGQPLTFSPSPLTWHLSSAAQNVRDYTLALHLADGTPLPPDALHLPGRPDFYLHDGVVYRGPPALDGSSAAVALVPREAVEQPEVLQMLRQLGTRLPADIEQRFVTVPLRARIECAIALDYAQNEIFTLQLLAVSDEPQVQHVWSHYGWNAMPTRRTNKPSGDKDKIHSFELTAPNSAVGRLADLKVAYDDYQKCWARRLTRNFPEEFLAWREALPPEIEVLAAGELATLLGAPVRARIDFDLIESATHRDWFDLALALKPEDTTLTPDEIALLLKARGKLVRLPGKGWRRLAVQLDGAPTAALEAAGFDPDSMAEAALAGDKHRFHALQLAQSAVAALLPERQAEMLRTRARAIARPEPPAVPAALRATLRPYQLEGFHFLTFLSVNQLGGVLADDMGLGKTVQTLAWLQWLAEKQPPDAPLRALVVCPKSVVGNWEAETTRFAPNLETVRFSPSLSRSTFSTLNPQLVLANYTQLRLAAGLFAARRWHAVILDEGQFIKTPTSKVAQVARDLPGEHRLILTGTPIENRLLDLWSLFAFSLPGLLGTQAAFKRHYTQDHPLALTRLRTRVRHFMLRRTKSQVAADLPSRTEEDVRIGLEGEQRKLYDAELKRARAALLKVETNRQFDKARFNILASLMRLRQICCHPALIDSAHRDAPSAKLEALLERIEELRAEGHQLLVFSQFVTMLELIREKLDAAGIGYLMLTGQTENRDALVRQFQAEKKHVVFLLSLKAAGFGLNLTAASYVILYDPWWNPAVEAQAIDRTHRIGQSVPVNAYRFIARDTVEEKIRVLQKEKAALAGAIVQEESLASVLDLDSLRQILA